MRRKNQAAAQLGKLGGKARALALSPEQRIESARRAAHARWSIKMDNLVAEIADGTKELLRTVKKRQRLLPGRKRKR
jgi:hypothetical protein